MRFVDGHGGWSGRPAPQLAFRFATVPQRIYLTSRLTLEHYVRQWVEDDLEHVHSYARGELGRELMPWLIERGYASSWDVAELPRFEQSLGARSAHLRPGLALRCAWPLGDAEDLDRRGELAPAIRTALGALLDALDEPPLPA
jgi:hypothetical protein